MTYHPFQLSRRQLLQRSGAGFGLLGLTGALQQSGAFGSQTQSGLHFPARARRVIFLFKNGGPSQIDTFDPKPTLAKYEGDPPQDMRIEAEGKLGGMRPSPFRFGQYGESGVAISELFPRLRDHADELCVIRSMHTEIPEHEPGLLFMHSGNSQPIRPSMGSWISYGLGTENQNLPAYVVLGPGWPIVGPKLWSAGFLPGQHQAMPINTLETDVDKLVANLRNSSIDPRQQRRQLDLLAKLNQQHQRGREDEPWLDAQIRTMELAYNMQSEAGEAFDLSRESKQTLEMYGETPFGRSCLLARRLAERGVRYIQANHVSRTNPQPWDTHYDNDNRHRDLCAESDRGTAALLTDLKERGMLDETLVVWGGEFGRTPFSEFRKESKNAGRDHQHVGFSMVLAGGGVRGGMTYGATDELGMHAVEDRVHVHDLHATILHQMGIDHEQLTYHYSGRDFRLTDVHGRVVNQILA